MVTGHNDVISMSNVFVCVMIFVLRVKPRLTITVCAWLLRRRRGPSSGVRLGEGAERQHGGGPGQLPEAPDPRDLRQLAGCCADLQ